MTRSPLRSPLYRRFLGAYFLDEVASATWLVTLGWVVSRQDSDAAAAGILFVSGVPLVVVLIFCGGWVDRHTSQRVAIWTMLCRLLVLALWLCSVITVPSLSFWATAIGAAALGAIAGVHDPAMVTYPKVLVDAEAQGEAVVLERGAHRLSQAVAGLIAGGLLSASGLRGPAFAAALILVVALIVLIWLSRSVTAVNEAPQPYHEGTREEAWRFTMRHAVLPFTLAMQMAITVVGASILLVLLPFRARSYGWTGSDLGSVISCYGVGMTLAVVAGFVAKRKGSERQILLISCGLVFATGVALGAFAMIGDSLTGNRVLLAVIGLCIGPAGPFLSGYLREVSASTDEDRQRSGLPPITGRISGIMLLVTDGIEPLIYVVAIGLVALLSQSSATAILAASCGAAGAFSLARLRGLPAS